MVRPDTAPEPATLGSRLRLARLTRGWSQDVLARRIVEARRARGENVDAASVKTQLSRWENNHAAPDRLTRDVVAEAFSTTPEGLFGLPEDRHLPRAVLLEAHVTPHTIELLRARRVVHAQTDASFGPAEAGALVAHDLATIDGLRRIVPQSLTGELHEIAALIAELGGWIAQDSGDTEAAHVSTSRAHAYARAAKNPAVEAMVLMRWANVVTPGTREAARASPSKPTRSRSDSRRPDCTPRLLVNGRTPPPSSVTARRSTPTRPAPPIMPRPTAATATSPPTPTGATSPARRPPG